MTQDNIDTILNRLNDIQTKNDADHARVEQRLNAIDARLGAVDGRLGAIDSGLQEVRHLIDADDIEKRLSI